MLARTQRNDKRKAAKHHLKKYGWSYRSAAPKVGVGYQHLFKVLNGLRDSTRLLEAVMQLPARPAAKGKGTK